MATGEGGPADEAGPDDSVDPRRATSPVALAEALTELRSRAGLTIREVSRVTGIPSATLGGWFSGRHLPPTGQKAGFAAVLTALGAAESVDLWWAELNRVRRVGGRAPAGAPPYRGLDSYDIGDAAWYVGREELTDDLVARVTALLAQEGAGTDAPRSVSVVGASGSGKSSLLRAGLAAWLHAADISTVVLVPGPDALAELASALDVVAGSPTRVVIVDQLEELFAAAAEQRAAFLERLAALASEPGTVVVTGLRADFYGSAVAEPLLLPLLRSHQLLLGPMSEDALRRVVAEPAARAGFSVDPDLVSLLLRDVVPPGRAPDASSLPLLSHALLVTWSRAHGTRLTVADYLAVGGVAGAVQQSADAVLDALDDEGRALARHLFSLLVNLDEDGYATRRRLRREDLDDPALLEVAERFVDGRILTATETTVEISHAVLLTAWPRLQRWLEEDREVVLVRRRLGRAAAAWERSGHDPAALFRGFMLERTREVVDQAPAGGLSALERSYLAAAVAHEGEEQRTERTRLQRLRVGVVVVAVLALTTSVLSAYLLATTGETQRLREAAEHARNDARSRQMAVQAQRLRATEPALAAQLALAAFDLSPTVESRSALLEITGLPGATRITGVPGTARAVPSPDGSVLAVAGAGSRVRLYAVEEAAVPRALGSLEAPGGKDLYAAAWSPDGTLLAVGGRSGHVTVLDVSDPSAVSVRWTAEQDQDGQAVQDLAFAPDGRTLLAAGGAKQLRRWRVGDQGLQPVPALVVPVPNLVAVAVAPDGTVAVGGDGGLLQLWRPTQARWRLVRDLSLAADQHTVRSLEYSPDGTMLAAGATDGVVRVHDAATGRPVTELVGGFTSWVNALAFAEGGRTIAAAASGGLVQLWSTADWELTNTIHGPANYTSVAFHEGTDRVVTADVDGMVRLLELAGPRLPPAGDSIWGLAAPADGTVAYVGVGSDHPEVLRVDVSDPMAPEVERVLRWPNEEGDTLDGVVGVSPDGELLVGGTSEGRLVPWADPAGEPRQAEAVEAADALIENVSFSADGSRLAATADDGSTTVYDVEDDGGLSRVARSRLADRELALGVALSGDGSWVATGGTDHLVHLWRADDPEAPPVVLEGFENNVYSLAFSSDSTMLAGGSTDGTVRVWDVTTPEEPALLATLRGPADTVFSVAFDPDGSMLAAASQDGLVWLWEWQDGAATPYARLGTLGVDLYQVLWLSTSDVVLAAGSEGQAGAWSTDVTSARDLVCGTTGTPVTEEEWEQYLPGVPFEPPC